ncbi:MAG: hypothetical protein M1827_002564 [Pycnora praestabilis]|nr:MAG: hypothetical protein M1827_002564 [Pycnora praestabilis]
MLPSRSRPLIFITRNDFCARCITRGGSNKSNIRFHPRPIARPVRKARPLQDLDIPSQAGWNDIVPPLSFFISAKSNQAFKSSAEQARAVLVHYVSYVGKVTRPTEVQLQTLLNEHDITPGTLTLLARIVIRSPTRNHRALARRLILSACDLSEPNAVIQMVSSAIATEQLTHKDLVNPLRRLASLADAGKNPEAMLVQGRICEREGNEGRALTYYEQALKLILETGTDGNKVNEGGIASVYLALGTLKLKQQNIPEATEAFRKAADLDDPEACFHLGKLQPEGSKDHERLLLKAAASGIIPAADSIGVFYHSRSLQAPMSSSSAKQDRRMAREWHTMSASAGSVEGKLQLGMSLWADDEIEEGLNLIREVKQDEKIGHLATPLLEALQRSLEIRPEKAGRPGIELIEEAGARRREIMDDVKQRSGLRVEDKIGP